MKKRAHLFKNVFSLLAIAHFALSFVWDKLLFKFSVDEMNVLKMQAISEEISAECEMIIVYCISKLMALVLIIGIWSLLFAIYQKRIRKEIIRLFGSIFFIGLIIGFFSYPSTFGLEIDNYANFALALRLSPTYWHSIYTGALYAGCMMAMPHPFSIFVFQWLGLICTVGYIYNWLDNKYKERKCKYFSLLLFVLPETYYIIFNAYRNNYYTILCLFYFAYLFFSVKSKKQSYTIKEIVAILLLSAFIMVWRTEGILIGLGGIVYLLLFVYRPPVKKCAIFVATLMCIFLLFKGIQDIGSKKYFGEDYMITNTTGVLYSIFNNPDANLSYEGAEQDLENIDAVVPRQILKETGLVGFWNYNWTQGREDFNQSMASNYDAKNYMRSYYRIIIHNLTDYLNVQINCLYSSLQISGQHQTYHYTGDEYTPLSGFDYSSWIVGRDDLLNSPFTRQWEENEMRINIYNLINQAIVVWRELWTNTGLNTLVHSLAAMLLIVLPIFESIKAFAKNKLVHKELIVLFLIILGEAMGVFLFMPEGRPAYMYPVLYSTYLVLFFYCLTCVCEDEANKCES